MCALYGVQYGSKVVPTEFRADDIQLLNLFWFLLIGKFKLDCQVNSKESRQDDVLVNLSGKKKD